MKKSFFKNFKVYEVSKTKIKKINGGNGAGNIKGVSLNGIPQTRNYPY